MLRSEPHPPTPIFFLLPYNLFFWCDKSMYVRLYVCSTGSLSVCQLNKQWGRPLPWEQQVSHTVDGWSSAARSHVSMCLSMCVRLCARLGGKNQGRYAGEKKGGGLWTAQFKKVNLFLWHSNKEGNRRAVLFLSCGFIFPALHEQSFTNRDLQTANLCLSDSESQEDHLGCM